MVTQSWSLSRAKPLAELFDAKNRLFHLKTKRKIVFMNQKELKLGVFFLPLRAWGSEGGNILMGKTFQISKERKRGFWADQHLRKDKLWPG